MSFQVANNLPREQHHRLSAYSPEDAPTNKLGGEKISRITAEELKRVQKCAPYSVPERPKASNGTLNYQTYYFKNLRSYKNTISKLNLRL